MGGSVYVVCPGDGLYKLRATTGEILKYAAYTNRNGTEPMIDHHGNVYAGWQAFGGAIYCGGYDVWDSDLIQLTPVPAHCDDSSKFTSSRATLLPDGSTIRWSYADSTTVTLTFNGTHGWAISLPGSQERFTSLPTSDDGGNIFVGSNLGIYSLRSGDGSVRWRSGVNGVVTTQPAIASDGSLYVGTSTGQVYAFR